MGGSYRVEYLFGTAAMAGVVQVTALPVALCFHAAFAAKTLPLPCASTAFAAKTLPLPCTSTAFLAETVPLPCASTAFVAKPLPFLAGPSQRQLAAGQAGRTMTVTAAMDGLRRRTLQLTQEVHLRQRLCPVFPHCLRGQDSAFASCVHCLRGQGSAFASCVSTAFAAETMPYLAVLTPRAARSF